MTRLRDPIARRIGVFLDEIGLDVRLQGLPDETVLPGITIVDGAIAVDESKLAHPGDLLHEAGHLAVVAERDRANLAMTVEIQAHEEMAAIAWSWAALRSLELDPEVVFHDDGYDGGSTGLIDAFTQGAGPGVAYLAFLDLCADPHAGPDAAPSDLAPFPTMTRWLATN